MSVLIVVEAIGYGENDTNRVILLYYNTRAMLCHAS